MQETDRRIIAELYRALVLLGADHEILATVGSWGDSLSSDDILSDIQAWNEATLAELRSRTEHYEMTFHRQAYNPDEVRRTA